MNATSDPAIRLRKRARLEQGPDLVIGVLPGPGLVAVGHPLGRDALVPVPSDTIDLSGVNPVEGESHRVQIRRLARGLPQAQQGEQPLGLSPVELLAPVARTSQ